MPSSTDYVCTPFDRNSIRNYSQEQLYHVLPHGERCNGASRPEAGKPRTKCTFVFGGKPCQTWRTGACSAANSHVRHCKGCDYCGKWRDVLLANEHAVQTKFGSPGALPQPLLLPKGVSRSGISVPLPSPPSRSLTASELFPPAVPEVPLDAGDPVVVSEVPSPAPDVVPSSGLLYTLTHPVSKEHCSVLSSTFNMTVKSPPGVPNAHALLHAEREIAWHLISKQLSRRATPVLSVGGKTSLHRTLRGMWTMCPVLEAVDKSRNPTSDLGEPLAPNSCVHIWPDSPEHCECSKRSIVLFIHSLYYISPDDFVKGMLARKADGNNGEAWVLGHWFPSATGTYGKPAEASWRVSFDGVQARVRMDVVGNPFPYDHPYPWWYAGRVQVGDYAILCTEMKSYLTTKLYRLQVVAASLPYVYPSRGLGLSPFSLPPGITNTLTLDKVFRLPDEDLYYGSHTQYRVPRAAVDTVAKRVAFCDRTGITESMAKLLQRTTSFDYLSSTEMSLSVYFGIIKDLETEKRISDSLLKISGVVRDHSFGVKSQPPLGTLLWVACGVLCLLLGSISDLKPLWFALAYVVYALGTDSMRAWLRGFFSDVSDVRSLMHSYDVSIKDHELPVELARTIPLRTAVPQSPQSD